MSGSAGRPRVAGLFVATLPSVSSPGCVTDGQALEAAEEGRAHPPRSARQLDGFQPRQQLREQGASLYPGQRCAEAVMHAEAERQVLVRVAADVEPERVVEDPP